MPSNWLVVKRGLYYRPNAQGYTGIKAEAGRFTAEEANRHSFPNGPRGPRDGITYVHEKDAPDYSECCCPSVMAKHIAKSKE